MDLDVDAIYERAVLVADIAGVDVNVDATSEGMVWVAEVAGVDTDVDAISEGMVWVADVAPVLNHNVNFGSFPIFSFSSAALFLFCAPLKTLCFFISAERVIHLQI